MSYRKGFVVGKEVVRAATDCAREGRKLCYLVALTFGRLRWRGAELAVGVDSKRGCRAQVSIKKLCDEYEER